MKRANNESTSTKKLLILIFPLTVFFSCQKDDNKTDPQRDAFATFQGKYLVCDSIKTTLNGTTTTQVLGKGKGSDITFGFYGNLDVYSSPATSKNYSFETPDKIYYWTTTYQATQFYTIQSMSGSKIVLVDAGAASPKVLTEYFTAE